MAIGAPIGALDSPTPGSVLCRDSLFFVGWALASDGVDRVDVYIDGQYLQEATVKGPREDVIRQFPQFAGTKDVRFIAEVKVESLPVGRHELLAHIVSKRGIVHDLTPCPVLIRH